MNKLAYTTQHLPREGRRLEGGLALQLHRGRDLTILDCSRIDQPPSDVEMRTVAEAVVEAYHPAAIWRGSVFVVESGGHNHHIWRLYWPVGVVETVYRQPAKEVPFPF
jgi:hypothetical protein